MNVGELWESIRDDAEGEVEHSYGLQTGQSIKRLHR